MKAAFPQQKSLAVDPSRSPANTTKVAVVLGTSLAAIGLLMATPAFGQSEPQNLTCTSEGQRLICNVQPAGQVVTLLDLYL